MTDSLVLYRAYLENKCLREGYTSLYKLSQDYKWDGVRADLMTEGKVSVEVLNKGIEIDMFVIS